MRLIDADALLQKFNDKGIQITFDLPVEEILGEDVDIDDFSMLVQDAIKAYRKMVIDTIKNQPTAFDTEKVVAEVMEITSRIFDYCEEIDNNLPADERTGYNMLEDINLLREIVKKGGVEWKFVVIDAKNLLNRIV